MNESVKRLPIIEWIDRHLEREGLAPIGPGLDEKPKKPKKSKKPKRPEKIKKIKISLSKAILCWQDKVCQSAEENGGVPCQEYVDLYQHLLSKQTKIYFAQESGMGAIKIGVARSVGVRIENLKVGMPHEVTLLATMDGDREAETEMHCKFAHARIRGEWFRPVPELLEYIAALAVKPAP